MPQKCLSPDKCLACRLRHRSKLLLLTIALWGCNFDSKNLDYGRVGDLLWQALRTIAPPLLLPYL
ncbi:hypothetical protein [Nostoc sp.]|uniref:hypothetical protein n=1 Tax=Nostoc sp. TaxID=1180 RepID=UPI002FF7EFAA